MGKGEEEKGEGGSKSSTSKKNTWKEKKEVEGNTGKLDEWIKASSSVAESTETEEEKKIFKSSNRILRTPKRGMEEANY